MFPGLASQPTRSAARIYHIAIPLYTWPNGAKLVDVNPRNNVNVAVGK